MLARDAVVQGRKTRHAPRARRRFLPLALRRSLKNLSRLKVEWGPIWSPAH